MSIEKLKLVDNFPFVCPVCDSKHLYTIAEYNSGDFEDELCQCEDCNKTFVIRHVILKEFIGYFEATKREF